MARTVNATAAVVDQQTLIQGVAKYFVEKVYGPDSMPWGTRFSDLEELSVQIGQAMSRSMIDQALARQAQSVPSEAETCSGCGGRVESLDDTEPRTVLTRGYSPLGRAETVLPQMSGSFFFPRPKSWRLIAAITVRPCTG